MPKHFALLRENHKAAIAVMSLGVLLLLLSPASLGFGRTIIIQEAFGQFNLPLLEEEDETEEEEDGGIVVEEEEETTTTTTPAAPADTTITTTPQDLSTYLMAQVNVDPVYGFIGSSLSPMQGVGGNAALTPDDDDDSDYAVTGRFRVFANETLLRRLVAEMNVAAVDGSSFHNITITEGSPHRFQVTPGNETNTAASSSIVGSIYLNGSPTPAIDNVPMTISIRSQVLAIQGIDIDETRIIDTGQRDILSILDGQSIYGTIPRT
ncbi:MAG: hypothetical protein M3251_02595 [Thermoproteota archaeon]|nr:hypothetical protein [Thermoproteota archaeon]